ESCTVSTGVNPCTGGNSPGLWSGGGGASVLYSKPSWQTGVAGIPNDGARDVPDVALTAAGHDPYLLCLDGSCTPNTRGRISFDGYSGTSAATPSMAGITAAILQEIGGRLGAINSSLYQLAATESLTACNASNTSALPASNCIFNDVTVGNNSVPGETGYNTASGQYQAAVGYDLASGLGSVNAANLAAGLTGTGLGTPVLNVSSTALDFGGVNLGFPSTQQITLSNTGNGNLIVSQLSITGASTQYASTLGCSAVILPNKTCVVSVTFTPAYVGLQAAALTVVTNASSPSITLSGTGIATASANISMTSLSFGTQKVVTRSAAQAITITNSTINNLNTASIAAAGANPEDFAIGNSCGATLTSGASCTVYVVFTPLLIGGRSATVTLPIAGDGSQASVSLSGTGTANGLFEIVSMPTGKVLEVPGGATTNGTLIQQNALNGYEQQQWQLIPAGNGYYEIQNALTGKALDVVGGYVTGGTRIQQWDYVGGANQQWRLVPVDDVHYAIINANSGLALDVLNGSNANGAPVQQWTYLGNPQQLWVLEPIGSYNITNNLSSYLLDVPNGSTANGTLIQQWTSNGYRQQQWQLIPVGGGYYSLMNRNSGKVLDVIGGSTNGGTLIQQWDYVGGENQQWQLVPVDGTDYKIMNRLSGDVLDDTNSSMTPGTFIQQWGSVGDKNQQWRLTPVTYYNIVNKNSGLVLDVVNGSTADGTHIQQWSSNGFAQQQWQLVLVSNGYYALMNNLTSKVMDVTNSSTADGTLIDQNDYLASASQQWQLISVPAGYYEIQNLNSGKALDMTGGYLYGGALLQQWDYIAGANQQWQLIPVSNQF
ncbi:MAG TPA: RICIN domain-containing protein, partial [Bryobacteraceae bacterium]|nr:RICIN domain-containing protein [Bryobacteraceae bacterium]